MTEEHVHLKKVEKGARPPEDRKGRRFEIVKLEERIAPTCSGHFNPQGTWVGRWKGCYYG